MTVIAAIVAVIATVSPRTIRLRSRARRATWSPRRFDGLVRELRALEPTPDAEMGRMVVPARRRHVAVALKPAAGPRLMAA